MKIQALLDQIQQLPVSFQQIEGCVLLVRDGEPFSLDEAQSNLYDCQGNREEAEIVFNQFYIVREFLDSRVGYSELGGDQLLEIAHALAERFKTEWRKTAPNRGCVITIDGDAYEPLELSIISRSVFPNQRLAGHYRSIAFLPRA
ncbi:MAG: hypothetical protein AAF585_11430 [Verrucomicrobiota bacterium]